MVLDYLNSYKRTNFTSYDKKLLKNNEEDKDLNRKLKG